MKNPHAVALGRLGGLVGGKSKSEAKRAAVRRNAAMPCGPGKKRGRPRKTQNECPLKFTQHTP
jgi:AT hook motif